MLQSFKGILSKYRWSGCPVKSKDWLATNRAAAVLQNQCVKNVCLRLSLASKSNAWTTWSWSALSVNKSTFLSHQTANKPSILKQLFRHDSALSDFSWRLCQNPFTFWKILKKKTKKYLKHAYAGNGISYREDMNLSLRRLFFLSFQSWPHFRHFWGSLAYRKTNRMSKLDFKKLPPFKKNITKKCICRKSEEIQTTMYLKQ